jgi:HEAT repeat protein
MARRDTVKESLAEIAMIADEPTTAAARAVLQRALRGRVGIVVAAAARVVADASLLELSELLAPAFERLLTDPLKRDPQCRGKLALVQALAQLEIDARAVYEAGVEHHQYEPIWGGSQDSAGPLRGACAQGLAGLTDPAVLIPIAELLADPECDARVGAVHAVVRYGDVVAGVPLLRLMLRAGESDPAAVGACVEALLRLDPERSLSLVQGMVDTPPEELADAVALALGETRSAGAYELLSDLLERPRTAASRRALYLALSMLRSTDAWRRLLEAVEEDLEEDAAEALAALALHREAVEAAFGEQLRRVVAGRSNRRLDTLLAELLSG